MFKKLSPKNFALVLVVVLLVSVGIVAILGSFNTPEKITQNFTTSSTNNNSTLGSTNSTKNSTVNSAESTQTSKSAKITESEFTKHFNKNDCWIRFEKKVYNITNYIAIHPGGEKSISRFCSREVDPVSSTHPGGPFGSINIQNILTPFYIGEME